MKKNKKILLTSMTDDFAENASLLFSRQNVEALVAPKDGKKVRDLILSERPDIVLMDVFYAASGCSGCYKRCKGSGKRSDDALYGNV